MTSAEAAQHYFKKAARIMDVGERIETLLATPLREVKVQVSIELDNGEIRTFTRLPRAARQRARPDEGRPALPPGGRRRRDRWASPR